MRKKALIFGVTGQDGSYCAELLLKKNYNVFGMIRKSSTGNTKNINHLINNKKIFDKKFFLVNGDLLDHISVRKIIKDIRPNEIYNFADQDHVRWSFDIPIYSYNVTVNSVLTILENIRDIDKKIKYFQPISSNIFGNSKSKKLNETTNVSPTSIYALAKSNVFYLCKMYTQIYGLKIYGAIFFNHESPRRGSDYVTQKIIENACKIFRKKEKFIELGDISVKIDWGYAKDYVYYAWKILQLPNPDFFIIGTGKNNSVKTFLQKTFEKLGLNYKDHLKINKKLFRPAKTVNLIADTKKAKKTFGYKVHTDLDKLIEIMIQSALKRIK